MSIKLTSTLLVIVTLVLLSGRAFAADTKFVSKYPCQDSPRVCISSGVRTIDGEQVRKDCWEWSYSKTCKYPSKNNCNRDCYLVGPLECLLQDSIGNCVDQKTEFSCKRWIPLEIENKRIKTGLKEKEGLESVVCKGIPCIDGNCVDKSYVTDGDMMDSIAKLYAISQASGAKDLNFKLFEGFAQHCSKKPMGYTNCCAEGRAGWGKHLGANCTKDENLLIENRKKNLCVYVGKEKKQNLGATLVKHHWCCFGNMLNKVIQVEGKKQLGMSFGSGGNPDCQGLTIEQLMRLDFNRMDLGEFIEDFKGKFIGKYKSPVPGDMSDRVKGSIPNIRTYDNNPNNKANNQTGWSSKVSNEARTLED
ncbi:MAG: conjugal transfer protein TraN [Sphingobacteriaceae bacterium]|nr:MAG: conjugal transfer protein TraN [Sphingobacteriaceae bacterium]